jgi:DNA-binding CsgD family transcriptional regulator
MCRAGGNTSIYVGDPAFLAMRTGGGFGFGVMAMHLGAKDLERALDVLQVVSRAESRDEFLRCTVEAAQELIPCMIAAVNEVDPAAGRFAAWYEPASFAVPPAADQLLLEHGEDNPLIAHYTATGDGSAFRFSDFVTRDELHETYLYQELYRPMGIEYQMSVGLPAQAPMIFALVLADSDRDFSERDRAVLNRIRPHLAQLWRNVRDLDRLRALVSTAQDVSLDQGWGVIMLWDTPEELTPGAFVTLYRHFGKPSARSPFPARVERWLCDQRAVARREDALTLLRPLSVRADDRRLVLRYLPAGATHPDAITIGVPVATGAHELESLRLTPREAEVTHLVITGLANKEIARRLDVSPGTVRKHLDNIYRKVGVQSRSSLAAFVFDSSGG